MEVSLILVTLILVTTGRDPSLVELELRQMCETESPTVHFKAIESADGPCDNPKKAAMHSCIFRGSFLLSEPASLHMHSLLRAVRSCLLIRQAYEEIVPGCIGLEQLATVMNSKMSENNHNCVEITDVCFIGRRLGEKKKMTIIRQLVSGFSLTPGGPKIRNATCLLADLRSKSQADEKNSIYFLVRLCTHGIGPTVKEYSRKFSRDVFLSSSTSAGSNSTTALDFDRCFLACSLALVRPGECVLDPFAGSCALPRVAYELFGATVFASDVLNCGGSNNISTGTFCAANAMLSPWRENSFDAIICDPPYGIRTAHLSTHVKPVNCDADPNGSIGSRVSLPSILQMAESLLRPYGRMAFWWFEKTADGENNLASAAVMDEVSSALSLLALRLSLIGIGYDDLGLGKSSSEDILSDSTQSRRWRRCIVVLEKTAFSDGGPVRSRADSAFNQFSLSRNNVRSVDQDLDRAEKPNILHFISDEIKSTFFRACWTGAAPTLMNCANEVARSCISSNQNLLAGDHRNIDSEFVLSLLARDLRDYKGNPPLVVAAGFDRSECVRLLLSAGADVRATGCHGATALMRACRFGHINTLRVLFHHYTAQASYLNLVEELCVQQEDEMKFSALAYVIAFDHADLLTMFPTQMLLSFRSRSLGTPMHIIARWNCMKCLQYWQVITEGASMVELVNDIHTADGICTTPLHLACKYGHLQMIGCLLRAGAEIATADSDGRRPSEILHLWHGKTLELENSSAESV
jgi:hypothetical protein